MQYDQYSIVEIAQRGGGTGGEGDEDMAFIINDVNGTLDKTYYIELIVNGGTV